MKFYTREYSSGSDIRYLRTGREGRVGRWIDSPESKVKLQARKSLVNTGLVLLWALIVAGSIVFLPLVLLGFFVWVLDLHRVPTNLGSRLWNRKTNE